MILLPPQHVMAPYPSTIEYSTLIIQALPHSVTREIFLIPAGSKKSSPERLRRPVVQYLLSNLSSFRSLFSMVVVTISYLTIPRIDTSRVAECVDFFHCILKYAGYMFQD